MQRSQRTKVAKKRYPHVCFYTLKTENLNNKLSISVGADVKTGDSEFIARYQLSRRIYVQTTTATSSNAADIFYTVELGGEEETETLSTDGED